MRKTTDDVGKILAKDPNGGIANQVTDKKCDSLGKDLWFCPEGMHI